MLIIGSVGITLIVLSYLEKQEKIYINRYILYTILTFAAAWVGYKILKSISKTFLLYI